MTKPLPPLSETPRHLLAIMTLTPVEEVKVSAASIISAVAAAHGISMADMKGPRRHTRFVAARHHAVAIICQCRPDLSYPVIGMLMNRDHSTIMYGRRHWPKIAGKYRTQRCRVADIIGFQWAPELKENIEAGDRTENTL